MSKVYKVIETDKAPAAIGAYSQGAVVGGHYYFQVRLEWIRYLVKLRKASMQ